MHECIKIVAKYFIGLSLLGVAIVFFRLGSEHKRKYVLALVVGGALAGLFAFIASQLYHNPRPFVQGHFTPLLPHGNDNGFPSDHTLLAAFLGWASLPFSRKAGIGLLVLAALIGSARMAAGLHHLVDVVGSFLCSGLASWLTVWLMAKLYRVVKKPVGTASNV